MKRLFLVALLLLVPTSAHARDSLQLVCTGIVMKPADGGERIALFFHFFESRAADGVSRDEYLSTIYQGQLFQGHYLNKGKDKMGAAIVLENAAHVRFDGKYTVDNKRGTAPYTMHVIGRINELPSEVKASYRAVDEILSCTDLSI